MKSKTFKEIVQEAADELGLPYIEVKYAVESAFMSIKEDISAVDFKKIKTKEEYENVLQHVGLKGFGSYRLRKRNYLTVVKNILNYDKNKDE